MAWLHSIELTTMECYVKRILLSVSLILLPVVASADFGIGASFKSSEAGIYFPVTITPRILVEPYLRYSDGDFESSLVGSTEPGVDSSFTTISFGAGLFGVSQLSDAVDFYYGARAAYVREESSSTALLISPVPFSSFDPRSEGDLDGFSIAPTLGFQYFLTDNISLGAEARWEFSEISGTIVSTGASGAETQIDQTRRRSDTRTDVLLRFYFN